MSTSKQFHIGDVLSITTGLLVSPRHVEGVYDILNHMTGDSLFTHQLPRASRECKPWLLRRHPELASVEVPEVMKPEEVAPWLAKQVALFGETLDVERIPADDHDRRDPISEMIEMVGPEKVIPVSVEEDR